MIGFLLIVIVIAFLWMIRDDLLCLIRAKVAEIRSGRRLSARSEGVMPPAQVLGRIEAPSPHRADPALSEPQILPDPPEQPAEVQARMYRRSKVRVIGYFINRFLPGYELRKTDG